MAKNHVRDCLLVMCVVGAATLAGMAQAAGPDTVVSDRVKQLTRGTQWRQVAAIPIGFDTQHPQGMVKIGDDFYVSSVEIKKPTTRYPQLTDGYDRDTGEGAGHLFKFDKTGKLLADRSFTPAASTTTADTSGCRSPSTDPTATRSSTASTRRR
jgi:hypothetical protein